MQMNQKSRLGLAAAIVAVMVLLVAVFGHRERPGTVAGVASPWLPQLQSQLGELRRLRLQSSAETVTLARGEAGWVVEERAAYPADFRQLETLLEALASARLLERKTARPEDGARTSAAESCISRSAQRATNAPRSLLPRLTSAAALANSRARRRTKKESVAP